MQWILIALVGFFTVFGCGATGSAAAAQVKTDQESTASSLASFFQSGVDAYEHQNYDAALRTFTKLAEQGHTSAQYWLGHMYASGQGVTKNAAQAVRWYRKAAEKGYASAQYELGLMYGQGKGTPENYIQGAKWLYLAKASGAPLQLLVAEAIEEVEAGMTRDQIETAQRLASKWRQDHQ